MRFVILIAMVLLMGAGCGANMTDTSPSPPPSPTRGEGAIVGEPSSAPHPTLSRGEREISVRTDFSQFNPIFRFSAELPNTWQVEYVPEIEAVNIYGPVQAALPARELSQIFIRYFEANDFLTLRIVDILKRQELTIQGHSAVRYTIRKKNGVPNFPYQPGWRNSEHQVMDVRLTENRPSVFYVLARNPALPPEIFEKFIASIVF